MNERIKQLLLESGFKIFGDKIVAGDFGSSGNATLCSQKFAELIVKECLMIVYERQVRAPTDDDGYFKVALDMASKDIEQHFGVKE